MKKLILTLVSVTFLFTSTFSQEHFKFGKSEKFLELNKSPDIFSLGDGFSYSFYTYQNPYNKKYLYQINKYDKDLNIIATNKIKQNGLHRLIHLDNKIIALSDGSERKTGEYDVNFKLFNPEKLDFEIVNEGIASFHIQKKMKAEYAAFSIIRNDITGNLLILKNLRYIYDKDIIDNQYMAICFNDEGVKIWNSIITFDKNTYIVRNEFYKNSRDFHFDYLSNPTSTILTENNDIISTTYSSSRGYSVCKITEQGKTLDFHPLTLNAGLTNDVILHQHINGEVLILSGSRKTVDETFEFEITSEIFNPQNNTLSGFNKKIIDNSKADLLFNSKSYKKFEQRRARIINAFEHPYDTFFLTKVLNTENGFILISEEMDIRILQADGRPSITKSRLFNIAYTYINSQGLIIKTEVIPRRHYTVNDNRIYSELGVLENKDNFHFFYLDASSNFGDTKASYQVWNGNAKKETHLAKFTINKHSGALTIEKPIPYPNSSYGIIPFSFKLLEGNTYFGVSQKPKTGILTPFTFSIKE